LITDRITEAAFLSATGRCGTQPARAHAPRPDTKRKPSPVVRKLLGYREFFGALLFCVPLHLNRNMKKDLKAAGIPARDECGLVVDVHALRHTFGTLLARGGVTPRVTQELLRHSDPRLTANAYTHLKSTDTGAALAALPALSATPAAGSLALPLALPECKQGQNGTIPDTQGQTSAPESGADGIDAKPCCVIENGPLTTTVISGPGELKNLQKVAAVGFEAPSITPRNALFSRRFHITRSKHIPKTYQVLPSVGQNGRTNRSV
jgi:hypothetical protein